MSLAPLSPGGVLRPSLADGYTHTFALAVPIKCALPLITERCDERDECR